MSATVIEIIGQQGPQGPQGPIISIPTLPDATTVNAADELIVQQGGITKRATGAELAKGLNTINGTVNVKDFGAVGDGIADDTAAFQAFFDHGGGYIPAGIYTINDTNILNNVDVYCDPAAIIKKRSGATNSSIFIHFQPGSEHSRWRGGILDGNRAALKSFYTAISPIPGYFFGWFGMKTAAAYITVSNVVFQNFVSKPAWFAGDYNNISHILFKDCGAAAIFGWHWFGNNRYNTRPTGDGAFAQTVENIISLRFDNDGVATSQHAIDLMSPSFGKYSNLSVINQGGDTNGTSSYASGITAENAENCIFSNWHYETPSTDVLTHLAFSLLGCRNCTLTNPTAYDIAGLALEFNACINMCINNPLLDGNYRTTSAVPSESASSLGVSYYSGAWNKYRTSKSVLQSSGCVINGGIIKRFSRGAILRGAGLSVTNVSVVGNLSTGIVVEELALKDFFTGNNLAYFTNLEIANCDIINNGASGLDVNNIRSIEVIGGNFTNNGQNSAASARDGITIQGCSKAKIVGAEICDSQQWTDADICSYEPQSPVNGMIVAYIRAAGRLEVGQFIKLVNADGASDVVGKIVDIGVDDDVTIQTSSSLSANGNTTALSGTWSGAGRTLSGVGASATTEILGQTYITDGTEWRRVTRASNNNQIVINEPFSTNLSGATLTKLTVSVAGIPSQQNGIRAFSNALQLLLAKNNYNGNAVQKTNLSLPVNCIYGSEYFRLSSVNPSLSNTNLQSNIPTGHRLVGIATSNTATITGSTNYSLIVIDSSATTLETIATGVGLSQNTKVTGVVGGVTMIGNNNALRAVFSGAAPTGGTIACEAMYKVDAAPALADA